MKRSVKKTKFRVGLRFLDQADLEEFDTLLSSDDDTEAEPDDEHEHEQNANGEIAQAHSPEASVSIQLPIGSKPKAVAPNSDDINDSLNVPMDDIENIASKKTTERHATTQQKDHESDLRNTGAVEEFNIEKLPIMTSGMDFEPTTDSLVIEADPIRSDDRKTAHENLRGSESLHQVPIGSYTIQTTAQIHNDGRKTALGNLRGSESVLGAPNVPHTIPTSDTCSTSYRLRKEFGLRPKTVIENWDEIEIVESQELLVIQDGIEESQQIVNTDNASKGNSSCVPKINDDIPAQAQAGKDEFRPNAELTKTNEIASDETPINTVQRIYSTSNEKCSSSTSFQSSKELSSSTVVTNQEVSSNMKDMDLETPTEQRNIPRFEKESIVRRHSSNEVIDMELDLSINVMPDSEVTVPSASSVNTHSLESCVRNSSTVKITSNEDLTNNHSSSSESCAGNSSPEDSSDKHSDSSFQGFGAMSKYNHIDLNLSLHHRFREEVSLYDK